MHTQDNGRPPRHLSYHTTLRLAHISRRTTGLQEAHFQRHPRGTQQASRREFRSAGVRTQSTTSAPSTSQPWPGEFPRPPTGRPARPRGTRPFSPPAASRASVPQQRRMAGRGWLSIGWTEAAARRRRPGQPVCPPDSSLRQYTAGIPRRGLGVSSSALCCHALGHLQALLGWRSQQEPSRWAVRGGDLTTSTAIKLAVTPLSSDPPDPPAELHPILKQGRCANHGRLSYSFTFHALSAHPPMSPATS